jgi:Super-infection exclusion protein B
MIADTAKTLLEIVKLAPRYLIALGVMAAFMLFAGDDFLKLVGLHKFANDYRPELGFALIGTVALFSVSLIAELISVIKKWWKKRKFHSRVTKRLNCLTEGEKQILRFYLAQNTRANMLRIDDGVVQGLKASGIIFQSASLGTALDGFAHNISDFAWTYLHENMNLLEGTTNTYRTDKRELSW